MGGACTSECHRALITGGWEGFGDFSAVPVLAGGFLHGLVLVFPLLGIENHRANTGYKKNRLCTASQAAFVGGATRGLKIEKTKSTESGL